MRRTMCGRKPSAGTAPPGCECVNEQARPHHREGLQEHRADRQAAIGPLDRADRPERVRQVEFPRRILLPERYPAGPPARVCGQGRRRRQSVALRVTSHRSVAPPYRVPERGSPINTKRTSTKSRSSQVQPTDWLRCPSSCASTMKVSHDRPYEDEIHATSMWEAGISMPDLRKTALSVQRRLASWRLYHFHDTSAGSPLKKTAHVNDNRHLRHDGSNLAAFLHLLREKHEDCYRAIVGTVRQVAPFFRDFALEPELDKPDTILLRWEHKGTDAYFDASSLSDGTLRFHGAGDPVASANRIQTVRHGSRRARARPASLRDHLCWRP